MSKTVGPTTRSTTTSTTYRIVAGLVAAEVVVQATAIAYYVAGLNRWMVSEGRAGVVDRSAMYSSDDAFSSSSATVGVLDQGLLRSAANWLDAGPGLSVHRVTVTFVGPALALVLLLIALAARASQAILWAGVIFAAVAVQAIVAVTASAPPALDAQAQVATFTAFAASVCVAALGGRLVTPLPLDPAHRQAWRRAYAALATSTAVAVVVQAAAVAYFVSGVNRYLETSARAEVWDTMLYSPDWLREGDGNTILLLTAFLVLPTMALALIMTGIMSRVRGARLWGVTIFAVVAVQALLLMLGSPPPGFGPLYVAGTFGLFTAALALALRTSTPPQATN